MAPSGYILMAKMRALTAKQQRKVDQVAKKFKISKAKAAKIVQQGIGAHRARRRNSTSSFENQPTDISLVNTLFGFAKEDADVIDGCLAPAVVQATREQYRGKTDATKVCARVTKQCARRVISDYQKAFGTRLRPTKTDKNALGARLCQEVLNDAQKNVRSGVYY